MTKGRLSGTLVPIPLCWLTNRCANKASGDWNSARTEGACATPDAADECDGGRSRGPVYVESGDQRSTGPFPNLPKDLEIRGRR